MRTEHNGSFATATGATDESSLLDAYHRAFSAELRQMIADLSLRPDSRVLDLACGDGSYAIWLGERCPSGLVVGVDAAMQNLSRARRRGPIPGCVRWLKADVGRLPFPNGTFDLVWCAQSLVSLPDAVAALREMGRVTRPDGVVAVLEDDSLHQILLPWPVDLEMRVRDAEFRALRQSTPDYATRYIGRQLPAYFLAAGLTPEFRRTYTADRMAPLAAADREFLVHYLAQLEERVRGVLDHRTHARLERLCDPSSPHFIADQPGFSMTCVEVVVWGRRR
ncbi:MAG TPA: methyltransferase domain-containing protein [Planctomycetaceae bacterium]|nr:methyltransferase domain-containing protein [Planctomycetaceae bacterium]